MGASNYLARLEFAMARGSLDISVAKKSVEAFLSKPRTHKQIKLRLRAVEDCRDQFETLVPWPALRDSLEETAAQLRLTLDRVKD